MGEPRPQLRIVASTPDEVVEETGWRKHQAFEKRETRKALLILVGVGATLLALFGWLSTPCQ